MTTASYDAVVCLDTSSHAAVVRMTYGLTGHVVGFDACLDTGFEFDVRRPLTARGARPLLRGDVVNARAVDEHERSFDLLIDDHVVGNMRLGQRVIVEGDAPQRAGWTLGLSKVAA